MLPARWPDRVRVGGERPPGQGQHLREHLLDFERAEERRRCLEQESQAPEILGVSPLGVVQKSCFDVSRQENPLGLGELF